MASGSRRQVRALGAGALGGTMLVVLRRLRGEPALPGVARAGTILPESLGIDPGLPETVTVVADPTAGVFDAIVAGWPGGASAQPSPPALFGSPAGRELGRGLDAERAALARQILDRTGPALDLAAPGRRLDGAERSRLVLARALARGRPWTLLERPLSAIPPERRRQVARAVSAASDRRGLLVVVPDLHEAEGLAARVIRIEGKRGPSH